MATSAKRANSRRIVSLAIAGITTLATVHGALADDAGIHQFFSAIFGGASRQEAAASTSAPSYQRSYDRPSIYRGSYERFLHPWHSRTLTVRLHKAIPTTVAEVPIKPGIVSIFEDRTLKRGDAVMMADGIRVFAGSASWPYTRADFIDLASAKDLNKDTTKVLAEVNRLPRG